MEQLPRDVMRPLARAIADALSFSKAIGGLWHEYHMGEPFTCEPQEKDTTFCYRRTAADGSKHEKHGGIHKRIEHTYARIVMADLRYLPVDPDAVEFGDLIIMDRKKLSEASLGYDNTHGESPFGPLVWTKGFANGENESNALDASWSLENIQKASAKATAGIGIAEASAEVSTETRAKVAGAWQRKTGRSKQDTESFSHSQMVPPHTNFQSRLTWDQVTQKLPWKAPVKADCKIQIGEYQDYHDHRGHTRRWTSGSMHQFDSIDDLIAVMERRGSVHTPFFEHFAAHPANPRLVPRIEAQRTVWMEQTTQPFTGASNIEVVVL